MQTKLTETMEAPMRAAVEQALAGGASAAKVGLHHQESMDCRFESGRLKTTGAAEGVDLAVDVVKAGKRGSAAGNDLKVLPEMVDRALALAAVGSAAHFETYPAPGAVTRVPLHAPRTLALTREQMIADGQTVVDALKAAGDDLDIHAGVSRTENESLLVTSGGVCHRTARTGWSLGGHVQRTEGTDMLFAHYGRRWGELNDWYDPAYVAGRIREDLERGASLAEPVHGSLPVFIPAEMAGMFFWPVLMGVNGRNVAKGDSPLRGRLGEQVLASNLTLRDEPHRPYSRGAEVDMDGVPTAPITLFEEGVLKAFLYNLDSAGLAGAAPTGHNGCHPYNLTVAPGTKTGAELLAGIQDGLVVKQLLGYGQSNIMNGDFSGNVGLGFRIRNGEYAGRVKDTMVAGNLYELMADRVEVSSDVDPISRLPALVLHGVSVAAR